jgi:hypothetical protein
MTPEPQTYTVEDLERMRYAWLKGNHDFIMDLFEEVVHWGQWRVKHLHRVKSYKQGTVIIDCTNNPSVDVQNNVLIDQFSLFVTVGGDAWEGTGKLVCYIRDLHNFDSLRPADYNVDFFRPGKWMEQLVKPIQATKDYVAELKRREEADKVAELAKLLLVGEDI